ncbi:MAG: DNA polymerase III subunit gamma/tau [bacterium]
MSYLVLARKYRPRFFRDVVGQAVVTGTLQGAIGEGRIGHAYLFSGARGTGKTTTARIFAKALNCETGPAVEPCGTCERCLCADNGSEADLIEIDAASHTGVDHVRDLRDQAAYAPMCARHKIYLIDEVHMLSKPAFNALLKTLEEPPPRVKFLFATTELHKLPDTIRSRCQILQLSTLSEDEISGHLDGVFESEKISAEAGVSAAIARRSRGGMRDALSLTDQLLALVGDQPTVADLERLAGSIDRAAVGTLVRKLADHDPGGVLEALAALSGSEADLVSALLQYLRSCLLAAHCGESSPLFEASPEMRAEMLAIAGDLGAERLEIFLTELLLAREAIARLPAEAPITLELCLLELARPEAALGLAEIASRLVALEARLGAAAPPPPAISAPAPPASPPRRAPEPASTVASAEDSTEAQAPAQAPAQAQAPVPPPRVQPKFAGAVHSSNKEAWERFLELLTESAGALSEVLASHGKLVELSSDRAVVRFEKLRQADRPLIEDSRNRKLCSRVFSKLLDANIEVRLEDASNLPSGTEDEFTQSVKGLFGGRLENSE